MPWCEACAEQYEEDDLESDGTCPECGDVILVHRPIPWHFKLLILATVVYLLFRLFQGILWVVHHV